MNIQQVISIIKKEQTSEEGNKAYQIIPFSPQSHGVVKEESLLARDIHCWIILPGECEKIIDKVKEHPATYSRIPSGISKE